MESTKNNEVKPLTLEEKKKQLIAEYDEKLKIAIAVLEKKEEADNQKEVVKEKIAKEFDTLKNAIITNSKNISTLIDTFKKEYHTSYYANVGEARTEISKRHARELNELNKQHKIEKENFKVTYNLPFDLTVQPKDEVITVGERINIAFAKRSNGTDYTPDYRILIIDNKATAIIKSDGLPLLSSIQVKYKSNNIVKSTVLKAEVLLKEANNDLSIVPDANRISNDELTDDQKIEVQKFIDKNKNSKIPSSNIKIDLGGDLGKL